MKTLKIGVVLLALLLVGMAMVPMVSAEESNAITNNAITKLNEPRLVLLNEKALKETNAEIIKDLKASSIIDDKEKELLIKQLNEIWSGKSFISESEKNKILSRVSTILLDTYKNSPSPQWAACYPNGCSTTHNDMARVAGEKMGIGTTYSTILYNKAGVPDMWAYSADHYAISGAPYKVQYYADIARTNIRGSNPTNGYTNLAYAMHFMSDMSQPFHYAPVYLSYHIAYESYVDTNWRSGQNYINAINGINYYYYISNPQTSAFNLASYSNSYQSYLVLAMSKPGWGTNPLLVSYTRDFLIQGERYDLGLIDYARRP